MTYDIETFVWVVALIVGGVLAYVFAKRLRRWVRHGENLDALAPELATEGAIHTDAFLRQRALLGGDLIRDAETLPDHEREIVNHALWHAMLLEAASDGSIDVREVRFVVDFFGKLSGHSISMEDAVEAARRIAGQPQSALKEIAKARHTSQASREHVLEGAFLVSLADGELIQSEADRLGDIADALAFNLTERQVIYQELTNRLED